MDKIEEIKNLKSLLDQGAISEEEFQMLKKDIFLKSGTAINQKESNTNQAIQNKESGKKSTTESKSEMSQSKSAKGKSAKRRTKSKPIAEESKWSSIFTGLGVLAGIILIFVFNYRYKSAALVVIAMFLMATPLIIFYVEKFRFSKPLVLFLLFSLYIFLIAVPIGNTSISSSESPSSNSSSIQADDLVLCPIHHIYYDPNNSYHRCPQCVDDDNKKSIEKARKKFQKL